MDLALLIVSSLSYLISGLLCTIVLARYSPEKYVTAGMYTTSILFAPVLVMGGAAIFLVTLVGSILLAPFVWLAKKAAPPAAVPPETPEEIGAFFEEPVAHDTFTGKRVVTDDGSVYIIGQPLGKTRRDN